MEHLIIPEGYRSNQNIIETQVAIKVIKDYFERALADALNLVRVSAPLFVLKKSGLNDNLNGVERPVSFDILEQPGEEAEIVHSLAKWKRSALMHYGFQVGEGLYTDMNAIRRDEITDNLHSIYVDQWDWEKVIRKEDRTLDTLKETVRLVYGALRDTERHLIDLGLLGDSLFPDEISFITAQELEDRYPGLTPKEREHEITKEKGAVFVIGIGGKLASGEPHDGRAPDYDDWDLNGDILLYYPLLDLPFEMSSMGIRVDEESLDRQLRLAGADDRRDLPFQKALLEGRLPYTIGGGIGQSRICMFLLRKAHIGEIQASIWPPKTKMYAEEHGVHLL